MRDAFGVKPFFHGHAGDAFLFGNDAACLLAYGGLDDAIDESVVADYLLAGENPQPEATFTRGLRRLPPGHRLHVDARGARIQRVPALDGIQERRDVDPSEIVREFTAHLERAVADRLPGRRAVVLLSGGVDSTAVAATARDVLAGRGAGDGLLALTFVYERLLPHEEGRYAALAADALGIAHRRLPLDDHELYARVGRPGAPPTQPSIEAVSAGVDLARVAGAHARVVLTGEGGDPALHCPSAYWLRLLRRGLVARAAREALSHARDFGRPPPLGLRSGWRRLRRGPSLDPEDPFEQLPDWLAPDFVERLRVRDRWRALREPRRDPHAHPTRPETVARLRGYSFANDFEFLDPGSTGDPLEFRHPFFDLRLLRFLLSLPAIPWCVHKEITRRAMAGRLPDAVRRRPKTPLRATPAFRFPEAHSHALAERVRNAPGLERFVRVDALARALATRDAWVPGGLERCFAAVGLAEWLHGRAATRGERCAAPAPSRPITTERTHERLHA